MADFRRQPEWQQNADRHSHLIDPVLTYRPISRFDYTARRTMTAIDHALVFTTAKGEYDAFLPPHRPTRSEAASRRYTSVYEVDTGSHSVQLEVQLPSDDDAFSFGVSADLTWRVADPVRFVTSGERDVPARLTRELQQLTRPVGRRYPIEDSAGAEAAVQKELQTVDFAAGIGIQVTCTVRMRQDEEAIAHRRRKRDLRYENEMLAPEHEYRMRLAQQEHELQAMQLRNEHELMAKKIEFYQFHLQHGGVAAWALHLAQHPEDTQAATSGIRHDQLSLIQSQLELIGGDALEDYQKAESAKYALRVVNDLIRQQVGPGMAPPPMPGEAQALPTGEDSRPTYGTPEPDSPQDAPPAPGAPGTYGRETPPAPPMPPHPPSGSAPV
ncbi:PE-PGRS family protein [Streptomyces sp. NBC_01020]|uniref:SPFH domain-containing protein n=1 Tax=unclassified Streptomyces TaxID=2593676 RepID=UPI0032463F45|nr:PE-PGRS family protein [Streptomyces sp. NBC_01020]WSX67886.1 PE-PGRS family protein [Streptomyces sp. NBC_00932]